MKNYLKDLKHSTLKMDSFNENEQSRIKDFLQLLVLRNEKYKELVQKSAKLKQLHRKNILRDHNFVHNFIYLFFKFFSLIYF